jgi:hypothetical protein
LFVGSLAWSNVVPRPKKSVVKKNRAAIAAQQVLCLFGPPPLLSTERREHFEQILAHLVFEVAPAGAIEQMWVYDIAVLVWEMMRLRRYKAMHVERWIPDFIRSTARQFIGEDETDEPKDFADSYFRDSEQRQKLVDALAESNLTIDLIDAEAFHAAWKSKEIEPMLASLQVRRDAIIREIGAYRDSLARRVKKAVDDIVEVPADDVEITPRLAPPARKKSAAA